MPLSLARRSGTPELIDGPGVPKDLLHRNLHELDLLNRALRGHAITMSGVRKLVTDKKRVYHIVDLGCGSGDTLKHIADWARAVGHEVRLTGVDKSSDAISCLREKCKAYAEITGVASDYRDFVMKNGTADVVVCSLFCHHLGDSELVELFGRMKDTVREGFVINDLHRSRIAYYGVKYITRLLNGSLLSRIDGPVSVLRGFRSRELRSLLRSARVPRFTVRWKWPFRCLVVGRTRHASA